MTKKVIQKATDNDDDYLGKYNARFKSGKHTLAATWDHWDEDARHSQIADIIKSANRLLVLKSENEQ